MKAIADKNRDTLKLALVAADIPISRQGVDTMEQIAGKMGISVVDKQAIPPAAAPTSAGAAARIIASGAKRHVTSWSPVTTAVQMLGALRRQGWTGWYIHKPQQDYAAPAQDPKLVMSPEYAFRSRSFPVFGDMQAAAKKYGVTVPADTLALGWASGMVLEAALKECGASCTRESLADALLKINVQTSGIYPDPFAGRRTATSAMRASPLTRGIPASQSVRRITEWSRVKAGDLADVKTR